MPTKLSRITENIVVITLYKDWDIKCFRSCKNIAICHQRDVSKRDQKELQKDNFYLQRNIVWTPITLIVNIVDDFIDGDERQELEPQKEDRTKPRNKHGMQQKEYSSIFSDNIETKIPLDLFMICGGSEIAQYIYELMSEVYEWDSVLSVDTLENAIIHAKNNYADEQAIHDLEIQFPQIKQTIEI